MESFNGLSGWGAGPISVLKDLSTGRHHKQDGSPGAESSSSDEGLTMSIQRQKASRSTAMTQRKLNFGQQETPQLSSGSIHAPGGSLGGPTVQKLETKFAAANGGVMDGQQTQQSSHSSTAGAASPTALSPLLLPVTPAGPPAGVRHSLPATAQPQRQPSPAAVPHHLRAVTGGSDSTADSLDMLGRLSSELASPSSLPTPVLGLAPSQRLASPEGGGAALRGAAEAAEAYLMSNPAFEAYLDSDTTDPDSRESDACTTPRSAIREQVATSPWLSRVQEYIQSPLQGSPAAQRGSPVQPVLRSAPPSVQRRPTPPALGSLAAQHAQALLNVGFARRDQQSGAGAAPGMQPCPARQALFGHDPEPVPESVPSFLLSAQADVAADDSSSQPAPAGAADVGREGRPAQAPSAGHGTTEAPADRSGMAHPVGYGGPQREPAELSHTVTGAAAGPMPQQHGYAGFPPAVKGGMPAVDKAKRGKGAPVMLLASGRSETAEVPTAIPAYGHSPAAAQPPAYSVPEQPLQQAARKPKAAQQRARPWRNRLLQLSSLCLLLLLPAALLVGHYCAHSPRVLDAFAAGRYGPAPASFGRCVQQLQQQHTPEDAAGRLLSGFNQQGTWKAGLRHLGGDLAVEAACAVSAARREAAASWAAAQPALRHGLSVAGQHAWECAASAAQHAGRAAQHVSSAVRPYTNAAAAIVEDHCPSCVAAFQRAAARAQGMQLAAWLEAAASFDADAHQHVLYHGWLLHVASSESGKVISKCRQAALDRLQTLKAPGWAAVCWHAAGEHGGTAAAVLRSACEQARAVLGTAKALLAESAVAVLSPEERAALLLESSASKAPEQAPGAVSPTLDGAADSLRSWVGRMMGRRSGEAAADVESSTEEGAGGSTESVPESLQAPASEEVTPAQTHVLRWPLPAKDQAVQTQPEAVMPSADAPVEVALPEGPAPPPCSPTADVDSCAGEEQPESMPELSTAGQEDSWEQSPEEHNAAESATCMEQAPCAGGTAEGGMAEGGMEQSASEEGSPSEQPYPLHGLEGSLPEQSGDAEGHANMQDADQPTSEKVDSTSSLEGADSREPDLSAEIASAADIDEPAASHAPGEVAADAQEDPRPGSEAQENAAESGNSEGSQGFVGMEADQQDVGKGQDAEPIVEDGDGPVAQLERSAGAGGRSWAATLAWTALAALSAGGLAAAAALGAGLLPGLLEWGTHAPQVLDGQGGLPSEEQEAPKAVVLHMRIPPPLLALPAQQPAACELRAPQTERVPRRRRTGLATGEDDEDSTLATDTAEVRRSGRARRSGAKTAPATAPPATRSRAVRFFTAPAAAAAEEQGTHRTPRRTQRSVGFDKGGRP